MSKCCLNQLMLLCFLIVIIYFGYTKADILIFSAKDSHKIEQEFRDIPARFGDIIPTEGIKGLVIYSNPPTACQDIKGPPNKTEYTGNNWIVLIARLNCSFEIKIRNAQKAGYSGAIVHNVNSNDLEPMSAKDSTNITIPSVFVSEFTGSFLKDVYSYDEGYFILINDLPLNFNTHLLLPFAIVVGICFLVIVIFLIVKCIKDRRRQRRHRLPNSSLKKIPTHKYTKGDPYETCAICLEDYIENEKLRVLPCAHAYHTKCIDPWLTKNRRVCPVCKRKVFAADERIETDSESDSDADDSTPLIRDSARSVTQGGTFSSQSENPFWRNLHRSRQHRHRHDSQSSESSYYSTDRPNSAIENGQTNVSPVIEAEDTISTYTGDASSWTAFLVSDSNSINDGVLHIEKSVSSTKPHTVNLSTDIENSTPDSYDIAGQNPRTTSRTDVTQSLRTSTVPEKNDNNDLII